MQSLNFVSLAIVLFSISASAVSSTASVNVKAAVTSKASMPTATEIDEWNPLPGCENLHGTSLIYCYQTVAGFKPAAASYLVGQLTDPRFGIGENSVYNNRYFSTRTDELLLTNAPEAFSIFSSYYSDVPASYRGYFSSVVQNALSLQNGAAVSPRVSGAAAAPTAAGIDAATAIASSQTSKAIAPRMTGTGMVVAAGMAAGVAGLAVGL